MLQKIIRYARAVDSENDSSEIRSDGDHRDHRDTDDDDDPITIILDASLTRRNKHTFFLYDDIIPHIIITDGTYNSSA